MKKSLCLALVLGFLVGVVCFPERGASQVLFFSADGMRPDLMEKYAAQGEMPTYALLINKGVRGVNGLVQAFPPNTGVGWYTLATGTYPSEHGSTSNTFFRTGDVLTTVQRLSLQVFCRPILSLKRQNGPARKLSQLSGQARQGQ